MKRNLYQILKSTESVGFEQTFTKYIEIFVPQEQFLYRKKTVVETNLAAIVDSSDVCCFDLYLINMFTKFANAERCTNLTLNCLFVTVEDLSL